MEDAGPAKLGISLEPLNEQQLKVESASQMEERWQGEMDALRGRLKARVPVSARARPLASLCLCALALSVSSLSLSLCVSSSLCRSLCLPLAHCRRLVSCCGKPGPE